MGSGKPLPYMNGWILLTVSFSVLYLIAKSAALTGCAVPVSGTYSCTTPAVGIFMAVANGVYVVATAVASVFPAPFNGYLSTGILFLAGSLTLGLKLLDAPLGSGKRFQTLEGQLEKRPGVKNPAALAATIGRNKYGAKRFAKLGRRRR